MLTRMLIKSNKVLAKPEKALWSNVGVLLHGEGTAGSTVLVDSSGHSTLTAYSGVDIQTSNKKFGTSSIYFLGTSTSLVNIANNTYLQPGAVDFTLEGWFYLISVKDTNARLICISGTSAGYGIMTCIQSDLRIVFALSSVNITWDTLISTPAGYFPLNTWVHLAFVRHGNRVSIYQNGVRVATNYFTGSVIAGTYHRLGMEASSTNAGSRPFHGFMDEVRIVKGQAIYTENFVPPTTAFPNS